MYEVDSSKFTSKPDPKKEFIHYLKETGACDALQKAMILLYKMPVKPHNLAEYFSEYFENGAQRLTRVSLLQAELCYKKDELEKQLAKELVVQNRVRELIDTLGISDAEFEERFLNVEGKSFQRPRASEVERELLKHAGGIKEMLVDGHPVPVRKGSIPIESEYYFKGFGEIPSLSDIFNQTTPPPFREKDAGTKPKTKSERASKPKRKTETLTSTPASQDQRQTASAESPEEGKSTAGEPEVKDKNFVKMDTAKAATSPQLPSCPPSRPSTQDGEPLQENDAFLFDYVEDLEVANKMLAAETAEQNFAFEFIPHLRSELPTSEPKPEICVPRCTVSDAAVICARQAQKSMKKLECPHCASGKCDCGSAVDQDPSLGFIPGKMINWTHQYAEYPCTPPEGEDYLNFGEAGKSNPCMSSGGKMPKYEIPLARIDSSCHCFAGYTTSEMLGEYRDDDEPDYRKYFRKLSLEEPSDEDVTVQRMSLKGDDLSTNTGSGLENELQKVFKQKSRKSSKGAEKEKEETANEMEQANETMHSDVFGIDLPREVRRTILGFTPSDLLPPPKDTDHQPQPVEKTDSKSHRHSGNGERWNKAHKKDEDNSGTKK